MCVDKLSGNGRIVNGDSFVADVKYEVRFKQQTDEDRLSGFLQRPPECHLLGLTNALPSHVRLTLVMTDGRKLDFFSFGPGDIRPTGAIYS